MSKLTLKGCQYKSIDDLFMALVLEQPSDKEVIEHVNSLTLDDKEYSRVKEIEHDINLIIDEAAKKNGIATSKLSDFKDAMKGILSYYYQKITPSIVLIHENTYISMNTSKEIDMSTCKLSNIEPFSDYYSEGEYRFVEQDGKILLDVDSIEPFNRYIEKVTKL